MKKSTLLSGVVALGMLAACTPGAKGVANKTTLADEKEQASYSIGVDLARSVERIDDIDSVIDISILFQGFNDKVNGKELILDDTTRANVLREFGKKLMESQKAKASSKAAEYLEKNKAKEGVQVTASGLQYKVLKEGTGPKPTKDDVVTAHYVGTLIDGTEFDSSIKRGKPIDFPVTRVIPGWTEALQLMPVGSKWQLVVPPKLGYGERVRPGGKIPPNAVLVFEVELLAIKDTQAAKPGAAAQSAQPTKATAQPAKADVKPATPAKVAPAKAAAPAQATAKPAAKPAAEPAKTEAK